MTCEKATSLKPIFVPKPRPWMFSWLSSGLSYSHVFVLSSRMFGTPTNVRTTNGGNDKRQNDKRQKGQT